MQKERVFYKWEKRGTCSYVTDFWFILVISFGHLKRSKWEILPLLSHWSWQSWLLGLIKAHNMRDGPTSQDAIGEVSLPGVSWALSWSFLHTNVRLCCSGLSSEEQKPVPQDLWGSSKTFFADFFQPFFLIRRVSLLILSCFDSLYIIHLLTGVHLHTCMSAYLIWCMFTEILACTLIWDVLVFH